MLFESLHCWALIENLSFQRPEIQTPIILTKYKIGVRLAKFYLTIRRTYKAQSNGKLHYLKLTGNRFLKRAESANGTDAKAKIAGCVDEVVDCEGIMDVFL